MSKVPKPRTLVPQGPQTKGGSNRQCNGMINNEQLYPILDMVIYFLLFLSYPKVLDSGTKYAQCPGCQKLDLKS